MGGASMRHHKVTQVTWTDLNRTLKLLQDQGAEILAVGHIAQTHAFVHYKEPTVKVTKATAIAVDKTKLEDAYKNYPRKIGKKPGMELAYKKLAAGLAMKDFTQAIKNFADYVKDRETKHIPYFDTFVRNYLDDFLPHNYKEQVAKNDRYSLL